MSYMDELDNVDTVYILGDLFEYWIGDDAAEMTGMSPILDRLKQLTSSGVNGFFIRGNRDFLISEQFSESTGFTVLEDESIVDIYGEKVVILHGDSLCTDDHVHQQFRQQMMCNPVFHKQALSMSIEERIATAEKLRGMSAEHKSELSNEIMDVNDDSVVSLFEKNKVSRMIHGHTHRPNIHQHNTSNGNATRIVLGDWYTQSSFLSISPEGEYRLSNLEE